MLLLRKTTSTNIVANYHDHVLLFRPIWASSARRSKPPSVNAHILVTNYLFTKICLQK